MNQAEDDIDWSLTSWEGSRRAQLRRWLALSVRERLQAIEDMTQVAQRIGADRAHGGSTSEAGNPARISGSDNVGGLSEGSEDIKAPLVSGGYTD